MMKTYNSYNRFVLFSNAPVCAYGHKIVRPRDRNNLLSLIFRLRNMFRDGSRPNREV